MLADIMILYLRYREPGEPETTLKVTVPRGWLASDSAANVGELVDLFVAHHNSKHPGGRSPLAACRPRAPGQRDTQKAAGL